MEGEAEGEGAGEAGVGWRLLIVRITCERSSYTTCGTRV